MISETQIPDRLASVLDRIRAACRLAGRPEDEVTLVAVTKRIDLDLVLQACTAGQLDLGENRVADALDRQERLAAMMKAAGLPEDQLRWHFIGHLQSRKAPAVSGRFCLQHGVDSLKLARKLSLLAQAENRREPVLLEVNAGRELQKNGADPDHAVEMALEMSTFEGLDLRGMMTMAPRGADEATQRGVFSSLRKMIEEARRQSGLPFPELSMGMSGDFEQAVAEGATLVRVGSAIFGPRE